MHQSAPEAPPAEPEVEPRPAQPKEPSRKTEPDPFNPDWPDDLPEPPPKAWLISARQASGTVCQE